MKWNPMPAEKLIPRLRLPGGKLNMVLDTDTYNEVDDQFALCYSLLSRERLNVQAVYAAPSSRKSSSSRTLRGRRAQMPAANQSSPLRRAMVTKDAGYASSTRVSSQAVGTLDRNGRAGCASTVSARSPMCRI